MPVTHSKVSAVADGADATLVLPSDWNAAHVGTNTHGTSDHTGSTQAVGVLRWQPRFSDFTATVTGTGTTSNVAYNEDAQLTTGTTSGSTAKLRTYVVWAGTGLTGVRRLRFAQFIVRVNATTLQRVYFYFTNENTTVEPSNTARHIGIRVADGTTYFSTADGTTEQTTDISSFLTLTNLNLFAFTYDETTAKCYVNGVLAATHTTNVPGTETGTFISFTPFIVSTEAVNKFVDYGNPAAEIAPL
jgi:hypothetical protein